MCFGNTTETKKRTVAPFTGAWIEILTCTDLTPEQYKVAPFTGAWIEISVSMREIWADGVAPFTGAWIEIGLAGNLDRDVAPFTGAWIEIALAAFHS